MQGFLSEAFAVVVRGGISVVSIGEPAFDFFQRHEAVGGCESENIFDRRGVEFVSAMSEVSEHSFEELDTS